MLIHGSGERYIGTFVRGRLEGQVRIYYNDSRCGLKFEGEFKNGKQHGEGVAYKSDGTGSVDFQGVYEDGSVKVKLDASTSDLSR